MFWMVSEVKIVNLIYWCFCPPEHGYYMAAHLKGHGSDKKRKVHWEHKL